MTLVAGDSPRFFAVNFCIVDVSAYKSVVDIQPNECEMWQETNPASMQHISSEHMPINMLNLERICKDQRFIFSLFEGQCPQLVILQLVLTIDTSRAESSCACGSYRFDLFAKSRKQRGKPECKPANHTTLDETLKTPFAIEFLDLAFSCSPSRASENLQRVSRRLGRTQT